MLLVQRAHQVFQRFRKLKRIFPGFERRSIILVMPRALMPRSLLPTILNQFCSESSINTLFDHLVKHSSEPVCSIPHKMVCSPIRSDFTSATNDDQDACSIAARSRRIRFSDRQTITVGIISGCTAMSVGTRTLALSSRTSVPGHLGPP